jgi:hypothetical protein
MQNRPNWVRNPTACVKFDTRYPILGHAKTTLGPFNDDDVVASDAIKGIPLTYLTE